MLYWVDVLAIVANFLLAGIFQLSQNSYKWLRGILSYNWYLNILLIVAVLSFFFCLAMTASDTHYVSRPYSLLSIWEASHKHLHYYNNCAFNATINKLLHYYNNCALDATINKHLHYYNNYAFNATINTHLHCYT